MIISIRARKNNKKTKYDAKDIIVSLNALL